MLRWRPMQKLLRLTKTKQAVKPVPAKVAVSADVAGLAVAVDENVVSAAKGALAVRAVVRANSVNRARLRRMALLNAKPHRHRHRHHSR
jgi:hypothetical protein